MAGTSYTRQSSMSDGDTMTAALFNNEFNQLLNAFSYSSSGTTGHQHDGGTGEGGNIEIIGDQDFLNKIVVDGTNNRWGFFVQVSSSAVEQIRVQDGAIVPVTDNDIDLGTSSLEFKDAYFDGTVTTDTLAVDANATVGGTLGVTGALTGSSTVQGTTITATTAFVPDASDGATLGTASLEFSDLYLADGALIYFGDDQDINITHVADTGLTTNGTFQATTITATTAFVPDASDGAALGTSSLEFSDLYLADGAVVYFGADQDVSLTHVADTGLLLSSTDQLQFGDSGTYIYQSADGVLDLVSDTEIELNATTIDINGAVDVSGEIAAASLDISGNVDIDGTTNLDAVDVDGTVQIDGATTFGVDDTGVDVKMFGATSGAYVLWDESADKLLTAGGAVVDIVKDKLLIGGTAVTTTAAELNVLDAVTAGTVTASLGVVVDSNKDIGTFRNITLSGELDAGSLDVSGDADIDGTLEADAITVDGTALSEYIADTVGAMVSSNTETNITVTYDDTDNTLDFVATGTVTALNNATENELVTVGSTTTELDAEANLTFDGTTLAVSGALTVDDVGVDGKVITMTGSTSDTATFTVGTNGTLDIVTTDDAAAAANIQITADGTAELAGTTVTLDSSGGITLDADGGTITFADGGSSLGTITSSGWTGNVVGNVTGNASGTAATVTGAAQTNITSLGTLTALTIDDIAVDGKIITMTGSASDTATITVGTNGTLDIVTTDDSAAAANIQITADGTAELAGTTVTLDSSGGITLDADGGTITFADGGSSLGTVTSSGFTGNVVGNVTGNASGTAATVTGAAQSNITSLGTLTALTIDDVAVDGKVITMTGSASDTATFTVGTNGTLDIVTTDDSAAAANIQITADGTAELAGTTVTLDSGGDIVLDADGADIKFSDDGTEFGSITNATTDLVMTVATQDKDMLFKGDDGGSAITALKLDMSDAGAAVFNGTIVANQDKAVGTYSIVTSAPTSGSGFPTGHVWYVVS